MRSNKSGKAGWWTKERQQYAYDRLTKEAKLSDMGAKGLISRWSNVEAKAGPTAKNPVSGAHGIGQWLGDRKKALGGSVDFTVQIDHAIDELNGKEKKAGDVLRNATTAEEGAIGASAYERAEGYNARTKRDNFTSKTLAGMLRVAAAPQVAQSATQGGLAAFFSDPLGLQAQAAEAPAGLAAFAPPPHPPAPPAPPVAVFSDPKTTQALRESRERERQAIYDARVRERTATPALSDPSFDNRFNAMPTQAQFDARMGTPPAIDASRFAPGLAAPQGPVSPEHYASVTPPDEQMANAAKFGSQVGAMAAPQEPGMVTDAKGTYAHPFGPAQFGVAAQASEMPADASAYTEQPHTVTTQAMRDSVATQPGAVAPALSAPQDVKDYNVASPPQGLAAYTGQTASLSPDMMAPGLKATDALGLMPDNTNTFQPFDKPSQFSTEPTIADPNAPATEIGPQGQTIAGDFPPAPEDSMFGPVSKAALTGLLTGGPIGGLLGAASGMLSGGLGSLGGPAGVAQDHETFAAGSGLGGMQQGMYGPRGATGRSLSQPGVFSTSRGPNQGYDLNNQYGARTTYGPSGDIRANSGTMDAWGRVLGGLFDRPDKSKKGQSGRGLGGLSQATHDAIGRGLGGLY